MSIEWKLKGKCSKLSVAITDGLFFSPDDERPSRAKWEREQRAKEICAGCPVAMKCLAYALETGQTGVWGETTDDERRKIKRVGHRVHCSKCKGTDIFADEDHAVEICIRCGVSWLVRAHV